MENFHEERQAEKGGEHQAGVNQAGLLEAQADHQVLLGRGRVRLQIRKFIDPQDGGDEEGQGQANIKTLRGHPAGEGVVGPQGEDRPEGQKDGELPQALAHELQRGGGVEVGRGQPEQAKKRHPGAAIIHQGQPAGHP